MENTPKSSWRDSPAICTRTATPGTTRWSVLPGADAGRICAESSWTPCRQHLPILWNRPVRPKLVGTTAASCSRLKKIELLSEKDQQRVRLEVETPMLRAFWCWLEKLAEQPLAGKLKTAVEYALKQRPYMENYLKDPRCQISNILAENAIRPFTVGRKNWLFCDSVEGAKASAIIYSIVETAKANNLSVEDYLRVLLEMLPE